MKNMNNLMQNYLEIRLLYLHIFSGCLILFLKILLQRVGLKPTINIRVGLVGTSLATNVH